MGRLAVIGIAVLVLLGVAGYAFAPRERPVDRDAAATATWALAATRTAVATKTGGYGAPPLVTPLR